MVVDFEVGKTYRYKGKIGDPSPFVDIGIEKKDARFIVSGKPLVCTYVERDFCPCVGFKGMRREYGGWAFISLYNLFDEVKKKTVAKEKQKEKRKEKKKEMPKFEVGKKYHYTGLMDGSYFDFIRICIDTKDAEYITSGKPLTVEWYEHPRRIKFKECSHPWAFTDAMLKKFEEVPAPVSKDKYIPVKKFEAGKWYVCHLNERPSRWNRDGKMDGLLDGKPHKCIMGNETHAEFEDIPFPGDGGWCFHNVIDCFEEVPVPNAGIDWEKKYSELEKRYHKLKGMFVEYLMDEEV